MVDIEFTVHTVSEVLQTIQAPHKGEMLEAKVSGLEIELVSDHYGATTLRFLGSERAEVEDKLLPGTKYTLTV